MLCGVDAGSFSGGPVISPQDDVVICSSAAAYRRWLQFAVLKIATKAATLVSSCCHLQNSRMPNAHALVLKPPMGLRRSAEGARSFFQDWSLFSSDTFLSLHFGCFIFAFFVTSCCFADLLLWKGDWDRRTYCTWPPCPGGKSTNRFMFGVSRCIGV